MENLPNLHHSVVRIQSKSPDQLHPNVGTGFYYFTVDSENRIHHVVVTNRHVVGPKDKVRIHIKLRDDDGFVEEIFPIDLEGRYASHPIEHVDVSAIYIEDILEDYGLDRCAVFSFHKDLFPDEIQTAGILPLERVVFIGFPEGLYDKVNLSPYFRQGFTATPYSQDHLGQPQFVIDAPAYPGSSGSPVILCDRGLLGTFGLPIQESRFFLLGILSISWRNIDRNNPYWISIKAHDIIDDDFEESKDSNERFKRFWWLNLAVVFKPSTIKQTVRLLMSELDLK